jgi:hypothetical protein
LVLRAPFFRTLHALHREGDDMKTNDQNIAFYEAIGESEFKKFAESVGFSAFKDLFVAGAHISPDDVLLEIGAGYGRCLDYFIQTNHRGEIHAIEKSKSLFEILHAKYSGHSGVNIYLADVKALDLSVSVDVALWMWSGFADFSHFEQRAACLELYSRLNDGGRLVIDLPKAGEQTNAEHLDAQNLELKTPFGTIRAYLPTAREFEAIQRDCGFQKLMATDYETTTGRGRTMYVLVK